MLAGGFAAIFLRAVGNAVFQRGNQGERGWKSKRIIG